MSSIIKNILSYYENIDFLSLIRTPYKRNRVYLDQLAESLDLRFEHAINTIKNELGTDINALIMFQSFNSKSIEKYKKEGIRLRGIDKIIERGDYEVHQIEYEEDFFLHCYWVENLTQEEISILIRGLIEMDHAIEPYLDFKVYFFKNDFKKVANVYDDRGIDIIYRE